MPTRPRPVKMTPRIGSLRPLATAITSAAKPKTGTAYTNVAGWVKPKPIQSLMRLIAAEADAAVAVVDVGEDQRADDRR